MAAVTQDPITSSLSALGRSEQEPLAQAGSAATASTHTAHAAEITAGPSTGGPDASAGIPLILPRDAYRVALRWMDQPTTVHTRSASQVYALCEDFVSFEPAAGLPLLKHNNVMRRVGVPRGSVANAARLACEVSTQSGQYFPPGMLMRRVFEVLEQANDKTPWTLCPFDVAASTPPEAPGQVPVCLSEHKAWWTNAPAMLALQPGISAARKAQPQFLLCRGDCAGFVPAAPRRSVTLQEWGGVAGAQRPAMSVRLSAPVTFHGTTYATGEKLQDVLNCMRTGQAPQYTVIGPRDPAVPVTSSPAGRRVPLATQSVKVEEESEGDSSDDEACSEPQSDDDVRPSTSPRAGPTTTRPLAGRTSPAGGGLPAGALPVLMAHSRTGQWAPYCVLNMADVATGRQEQLTPCADEDSYQPALPPRVLSGYAASFTVLPNPSKWLENTRLADVCVSPSGKLWYPAGFLLREVIQAAKSEVLQDNVPTAQGDWRVQPVDIPAGSLPVYMVAQGAIRTALFTNFHKLCTLPAGSAGVKQQPMLQPCQPNSFTPVPGAAPVPYTLWALQWNLGNKVASVHIRAAGFAVIRGERLLPGDRLSRMVYLIRDEECPRWEAPVLAGATPPGVKAAPLERKAGPAGVSEQAGSECDSDTGDVCSDERQGTDADPLVSETEGEEECQSGDASDCEAEPPVRVYYTDAETVKEPLLWKNALAMAEYQDIGPVFVDCNAQYEQTDPMPVSLHEIRRRLQVGRGKPAINYVYLTADWVAPGGHTIPRRTSLHQVIERLRTAHHAPGCLRIARHSSPQAPDPPVPFYLPNGTRVLCVNWAARLRGANTEGMFLPCTENTYTPVQGQVPVSGANMGTELAPGWCHMFRHRIKLGQAVDFAGVVIPPGLLTYTAEKACATALADNMDKVVAQALAKPCTDPTPDRVAVSVMIGPDLTVRAHWLKPSGVLSDRSLQDARFHVTESALQQARAAPAAKGSARAPGHQEFTVLGKDLLRRCGCEHRVVRSWIEGLALAEPLPLAGRLFPEGTPLNTLRWALPWEEAEAKFAKPARLAGNAGSQRPVNKVTDKGAGPSIAAAGSGPSAQLARLKTIFRIPGVAGSKHKSSVSPPTAPQGKRARRDEPPAGPTAAAAVAAAAAPDAAQRAQKRGRSAEGEDTQPQAKRTRVLAPDPPVQGEDPNQPRAAVGLSVNPGPHASQPQPPMPAYPHALKLQPPASAPVGATAAAPTAEPGTHPTASPTLPVLPMTEDGLPACDWGHVGRTLMPALTQVIRWAATDTTVLRRAWAQLRMLQDGGAATLLPFAQHYLELRDSLDTGDREYVLECVMRALGMEGGV